MYKFDTYVICILYCICIPNILVIIYSLYEHNTIINVVISFTKSVMNFP